MSRRVRVGVDGRSLRASAGQRGIGRYLGCLLAELARANPDDRYAVLVPGAIGEEARRLAAPNIELHGTRLPSQAVFGAAALAGRPRADRMVGGCDVFWAPAVAPLAVSAGTPFVVTVHDLSFEHRPRDYSRYQRAWHALARPRRLGRRAARVITVSETVRREVEAEWGLAPGRVVTVLSGPGNAGREPAGAAPARGPGRSALPERFFLAVGALEPRKRPELLVDAHARARAEGLEAGLVFAGEGPLRERLSSSGATLLGYVQDEQLHDLYAGALALVCVSSEEGFAFTPLEALARGTPAIVADLPVFTETVGGGALPVPPGDADALAQALLRLERDGALRQELVTAGASAAAGLSWERAAGETRAVLEHAATGAGART